MAQSVIIHLMNEDPVLAELERMPEGDDTTVTALYPRRTDGKPITYLSDGAAAVIFPMHRVSSIEVVSTGAAEEEEVTFYRE
jgi:hypothetical protein